jgi:hypothetical protein
LLDDGVGVDITGNGGRIPLRATAFNGQLGVNQHFLRNGCSVRIVRKHDLTALLAAVDWQCESFPCIPETPRLYGYCN